MRVMAPLECLECRETHRLYCHDEDARQGLRAKCEVCGQMTLQRHIHSTVTKETLQQRFNR